MSLQVTGVWEGGTWAATTWAADVWREGAASSPTIAYYSQGIAQTADGAQIVQVVAENFTGNAGDVILAGTRYTSTGIMYTTTATPSIGTEVFIQGFLHTAYGVRFTVNGEGVNIIPDGYAVDSIGRMCTTSTVSGVYSEGVLRTSTGRLVIAT